MELYIGGKAQGKYEYVKKCHKGEEVTIWNHYEQWFFKELQAGSQPEDETLRRIDQCPNLVIICNEIGNGIVPMDREERMYRERLGRMLCELASQSNRVERIICGIGQRLK